MNTQSNYHNMLLLFFLAEQFFHDLQDDTITLDIVNSLKNDLLRMAPIVNGDKSLQVYVCKFRWLKASIVESLIVDRIGRGESVSAVSSMFDLSIQQTYRICKKYGVNPKRSKRSICAVYKSVKFIDSEIVKLMVADGMSRREVDLELKTMNIA